MFSQEIHRDLGREVDHIVRNFQDQSTEHSNPFRFLRTSKEVPEGSSKWLGPTILGYVFEKTINYITGEGSERRKALGAYYTPEDVTSYISANTIRPYLLEEIKNKLPEFGWRRTEVDQYQELRDFLNPKFIPKSPKVLRKIYNLVKNIKILDPACGSGHFLTSAMKKAQGRALYLRRCNES